MKIGDKVRFLNTTGGGIISGFQDKNIILVEDEDGFEIPVLAKECVVIGQVNEDTTPATSPKKQTNSKYISNTSSDDSLVSENKKAPVYDFSETKEGEQISAYLGFVSTDIKNISTAPLEYYLINDSNYFLDYQLLIKENNGNWISVDKSTIEPNTKLFIEEIEKGDLNKYERFCVQFIAYKKGKAFQLKNPCSTEVRIDPVKFYKLHSFKENDFFDDNALLYTIIKKDVAEKQFFISAEELEKTRTEKKEKNEQIKDFRDIKKAMSPQDILEIDLHSSELLDTTAGLSPKDILDYQLQKFREAMNQNSKNKGKKIVFIHGKGDGVLKKELLKILKREYQSAYYQDASFREYGYGATMITIR